MNYLKQVLFRRKEVHLKDYDPPESTHSFSLYAVFLLHSKNLHIMDFHKTQIES